MERKEGRDRSSCPDPAGKAANGPSCALTKLPWGRKGTSSDMRDAVLGKSLLQTRKCLQESFLLMKSY